MKDPALKPATPEEVEWAHARAAGGYTNDFIRRNVLTAASEADAIKFLKSYQNGGGAGPSGAPGNVRYCYDLRPEGASFWFGKKTGEPGDANFLDGERHVKITWTQVARRIRQREVEPSLF